MSRWLAFLPLVAILALGALFGLYALHRNPQVLGADPKSAQPISNGADEFIVSSTRYS